jgi:glyoxylase I family protein
MPTFAGIDHLSLTVTDLDRSERFYAEVLDFVLLLDFGYGRMCIHVPTGFFLGLVQHPEGSGEPFSELRTGLDHLGFAAADRDELETWQARLHAAGVRYTPIRDMQLGHHLNFRDPDDIALELTAPNDLLKAALEQVRREQPSPEQLRAAAAALVGAELPSPARPARSPT